MARRTTEATIITSNSGGRDSPGRINIREAERKRRIKAEIPR